MRGPRMILRGSFLALVLGLLAGLLPAQAEVVLKTGKLLARRGEARAGRESGLPEEKAALQTEGPGKAIATFKYDELAPKTIYRLRMSRTDSDYVKGQMQLAAYALENGLFEDAITSYQLALKANEKQGRGLDAELKALYDSAPPVVLRYARQWIDDGKILDAEKLLARFCENRPDSPEAGEAHKMLYEIAERAMGARDARRQRQTEGVGSQKTAQEAAKPAKVYYDRAHAKVREALGNTRNQSQAVSLMSSAISDFEKALRLLGNIMEKEGEASDLAAHYDAWDAAVKNDIIETHLHIASIYLTRGSFNQSQRAVNQALALDPNNSEALAMRGRIEIAANEGSSRWRR